MGLLSLIAELGININPYIQGLAKAKSEAGRFAGDVGSTFKGQLAGAFGVAAITAFAKKTMDLGGQLKDTSARLNVNVEKLQEWNYAAKQTSASAEDVTNFFEHIAAARLEALAGDEKALANFAKLKIALKDLKNENLDTEGLGKKIGTAVQVGDIQKLSGALKELGGKSATRLVPAMKEGLGELGEEARKFGLIMSQETIDKMDELGDKIEQVFSRLMGPMSTLLGWINSGVKSIEQFFQLLGAFSTKVSWKDFLVPGRIAGKFGEFLTSPEAAAIVNQPDPRKIAPPKENFGDIKNQAAAKQAEKLAELRLKVFEQGEKAALKEMTKEEQMYVLTQKRAALLAVMNNKKTGEEGKLNAASDLIGVEEQLADLRKKDTLKRLGGDSLAQVGGYLGRAASISPTVDIARSQLAVQKQIARNTNPTGKPTAII
jgi:hypothetical protein